MREVAEGETLGEGCSLPREVPETSDNVLLSAVPEGAPAGVLDTAAAASSTALATELTSALGYAGAARAPATVRAYRADMRTWEAWCAERSVSALPADPAAVAAYLAWLADAGRKVSTIERALVAISQAHRTRGLVSPRAHEAVRSVLKGIRRRVGTAPRQKAALSTEHLRAMVSTLPPGCRGSRDRALLVLGFAGAFRRAELVALDVNDLAFGTEGLVVLVRRSKTDQEAEGRSVGIPYGGRPETCPVRTTRAWLDAAHITEGAVFRRVIGRGRVADARLSGRAVACLVQRVGGAAGLDPATLAGHSLRAGLATAAARAGKGERAIMAQTGHRSVTMVRRYIRCADLFSDNAAGGIGL